MTIQILVSVLLAFNTGKPVPDSLQNTPFKEGILYTRISFPGNILNEGLQNIDFEKGNVQEQLKEFSLQSNNKVYMEKMQAKLNTMSNEEKVSMGKMMMAAMMSPLYARIYYGNNKVLAKANAVNYSMESFMDTQNGNGKMVVISNDKKNEAAIEFSAGNMRKVWEKEEVDASQYEMKYLPVTEAVAGYTCKKVVYTCLQENVISKKEFVANPAYRLIVWYSDIISDDINFLHPFYFKLDKGILKIEVHYDKKGLNKMLYEVTKIQHQPISNDDFTIKNVQPVVNWDNNPVQASMNMLSVMMSSEEE